MPRSVDDVLRTYDCNACRSRRNLIRFIK